MGRWRPWRIAAWLVTASSLLVFSPAQAAPAAKLVREIIAAAKSGRALAPQRLTPAARTLLQSPAVTSSVHTLATPCAQQCEVGALFVQIDAVAREAALVAPISRAVTLDAKQFPDVSDPIGRYATIDSRDPLVYAEEMRALGLQIKPLLGGANVKRVVYPMAGDDAALPVHLFPDAEMYVLLDGHAFAHPNVFEGAEVVTTSLLSSPWVNFRDLNSLTYASRSIIPSLRRQFPELTALNVRVFETGTSEVRNTLHTPDGTAPIVTEIDGDTIRVAASHGLITFRTAPGAPVKTIVYLNAAVPNSTRAELSAWWIGWLRAFPPDAVIAKASQEGLRGSFGGELERIVAEQNGFVVEGMMQFTDDWEMLGETAGTVLEAPFGYRGRARVTQLEKPPSD